MPDVEAHPDEATWAVLRRCMLDAAARQDDPATVVAVADAIDTGAVTLRVDADAERMVVSVAGQELCRVELELLGL